MPKSRAAGGSRDTSRPAISIMPSSCGSRPAIARSSVVLPQPEGPRKQTNSPFVTSRSMFFSAVKRPKRFVEAADAQERWSISLDVSAPADFADASMTPTTLLRHRRVTAPARRPGDDELSSVLRRGL